MATRTRHWRWGVAAATAVLLVLFARSVNWSEAWEAIRRASPLLLLLAGLANLASLAARGARWGIFLRPIGVRSFWLAIRGAVVGSGLNNLIPASGGEAARTMLVARRRGVRSASVAASVAMDRMVDVASYAALLVLASLLIALPQPLAAWIDRAETVLALLIALGATAVWLAIRRRRRRPGAPQRAPPRHSRLRAFTGHFLEGLGAIPSAKRLAPAVALSMLSWVGQLVTYHLTARAAGLDVSVIASGVAMLVVNLAFIVQITPGNVGVFQVLYALAMAAFGVPRGQAVGTALLIQALQIIPVTTLALVLAPDMALRRRSLDVPRGEDSSAVA